ncbi:hypothetical protein [Streptomyces longisporoflavus]|uniref:PRTase associated wHTH domain-containing protein n=1 Tax=Streptomyces longisporoflavus TaxID=28044 RepID=A0ABW7QXR4_9ACTN
MATSAADWSRARVLSYDRREPGDGRLCLLWPAWAYRVTAPVLKHRGLDLFERVVLGLCQAGVRRPDRMGALIELDARLCAHILDRAVDAGHLNERHELTDQGRQALRTGSTAESPEWQVCHVFEDPFSGELWPRTTDSLREAHVLRHHGEGVELQLGTAGKSDRASARRVRPPDRPPQRPNAARVVAAASEDRDARRVFKVRQYERRSGLDPVAAPEGLMGSRGPGGIPENLPELNRVAFLNDPEPVYLVGFLEVSGDADTETAEAWTAYDPFGLGPSDFFQSLVYRFGREDGTLDEEIQVRAAAELAAASARYIQADQGLRDLLEERLAHDFGPEIRSDRDAFDLMLELDIAVESTNRDESMERIVHTALRLYEVLFRRMMVAYPVNDGTFRTFKNSPTLRRAMLEDAAQSVGFHGVTRLYSGVRDGELDGSYRKPEEGFLKAMFPLSLLAAKEHADHPLRPMAVEQPDLPLTLTVLNPLRNRGAHAGRDATNPHDAQWCRDAAACAVRALLRLPHPRTERTSL